MNLKYVSPFALHKKLITDAKLHSILLILAEICCKVALHRDALYKSECDLASETILFKLNIKYLFIILINLRFGYFAKILTN